MDFAATQNFCEGATQNFCDGDESDEEDKPQLIRLLDGGNAGVTMLPSVDGGVLSIGRAASDDGASALLLTDESQPQPPKVSARQAEVRLVNGAFTLHVLSSATFTFVNEQHYIKPGGGSPPAVSLFHEDTLRFGGGIKASQRYDKFVFRVHAPEHPRPGNNGVAAAAQGGVTGEMPIVAEQIGSGEGDGEWAKASLLLPAVATEAAIAAPSAATSSEAPSAPAASLLGKRAAPASDVMLGAAAGCAVAGGAVAGGEPASTESASAGQASVAGSAGREFQVATLSSSARGVERGFKVRFSARGPEQAGWSSVLPPVLQFAVVKRESITPSLQRVAFRLTDLAGEFEPWLKFVRSSSSRCGCMQLPGGASVITTAVVGSELACELVGGGGALAEMERQLAAKSRAMSELAAERDAEAAARKEAEERAVELQQEVEEWENLSRDAATMREGMGQQADCGPGELTQQLKSPPRRFRAVAQFVRSSSSRCGCMQLPGGASVITTAVVGSELACELVGGGGALAEMERQLAAKSRAMSELAAERDAEAAARKEAEERAVELQQEVEEWENLSRDAATMREGMGQQADCGPGELTQQVDDLWSVVEEPGDELRQRDQELMRKVRLLLERALNRTFDGGRAVPTGFRKMALHDKLGSLRASSKTGYGWCHAASLTP
ncbi:hypothetical protein EMIHUDRAFT_223383 [Emiliania huxleyi CCMP1516]|uniref:FHA domain-containing protein n=2 Tax=Emiliania huxleyi TaxID=2903 RepID=A0A0D3KVP5_EMIH1|nr:hypothetical protein EMIHUDRAFT_223383 [Emiliania huxleyi CCMP1516]EOD39830.1 hypothetical protein EMIHUDRAFT_223383 [Emiliania huxleyi CCMP1516]|eukprot:XP_005792259.1 hypothetical protein EMIHUDRAFT_223383 [Emiliania huxleyi CCMP1516]